MSKTLSFNDADVFLMKRLLRVADYYFGSAGRNPVVVAALVKSGVVLSVGIHRVYGGPHAEVLAIHKAGDDAKGAHLYVTLSPCTHYGKTPPCTEAIVHAGISRVFYACEDPNPKQKDALSAAEFLIDSGIEVVSGLCEDEAKQVYRVFLYHIRYQRPYVLLKAAMSLDGKIAASDRQSKYLTGELSLRYVHQLRRCVDAIVVGIQTVLDDDPLLTVRYDFKPVSDQGVCRVVIDPQAKLHANLKLVQDDSAPVLWVVSEDVDLSFNVEDFSHIQVLRRPVEQGHFSWCDLLSCFYQQFLWVFVMIEGGQGIYRSILIEKQVQEVVLFFAPLMLLSGESLSLIDVKTHLGLVDALHFSDLSVQLFGNDVCVTAYPVM